MIHRVAPVSPRRPQIIQPIIQLARRQRRQHLPRRALTPAIRPPRRAHDHFRREGLALAAPAVDQRLARQLDVLALISAVWRQ